MQNIVNWFRRQLNNPQIIILAVILLVFFALIIFAGNLMAPVIASIVIAYILEGAVKMFEVVKVPRLGAVLIVLGCFVILCFALILEFCLWLVLRHCNWRARFLAGLQMYRLHCCNCQSDTQTSFPKHRFEISSAQRPSLRPSWVRKFW